MTAGDYVADVAVGGVIGAATGGIGAGGSALTKGASGLVKLGVRVGAGAASGAAGGAISAAVDSTMQYAETGEVDLGQVAIRSVIAASAESARFASERTTSHANKVTKQRIKEDFKDSKDVENVKKMIDKANEIPSSELKDLRKNMNERERGKDIIRELNKNLGNLKKEELAQNLF